MPFEHRALSSVTWSLLIGALVLLAVPTGVLAAPPGAAPALQVPQPFDTNIQPSGQIARGITTTGCSETALATPALAATLPVLAVESLLTPSLVPNPCYQFDNPSTGCYYKWRPSDFCCVSPSAWCPAICY